MRARKRPYLPILDRSLELFARLRPPSWIFKMSRLLSRVGDLYLLYLCFKRSYRNNNVRNQSNHNNVLYVVFYHLFDYINDFSKNRNKSEISTFLSIILFYRKFRKKRVGWSPQEILSHSTSRNILIRPEGTI